MDEQLETTRDDGLLKTLSLQKVDSKCEKDFWVSLKEQLQN